MNENNLRSYIFAVKVRLSKYIQIDAVYYQKQCTEMKKLIN